MLRMELDPSSIEDWFLHEESEEDVVRLIIKQETSVVPTTRQLADRVQAVLKKKPKQQTTKKTELDNDIREYNLIWREEIGIIRSYQHHLRVKEDIPHFSRRYPIPLKYKLRLPKFEECRPTIKSDSVNSYLNLMMLS
ncbi:hypothetical protein KM043_018804 [Ampulex compressa]|nr:hypothetical protein KM043_018804 [Ampulex compressa]